MSATTKHAPRDRDDRHSACGIYWWRGADDPKRASTPLEVTCRICLRSTIMWGFPAIDLGPFEPTATP